MTNMQSEGKRHIRKTLSLLLSVILVFTSHSAFFADTVRAVPGETVSEDITYEETASGQTLPEETVSGENLPEDAVSDNKTVPDHAVSDDEVSENEVSEDAVSADSVSGDNAYPEDIPFGAFDDNIEIENPEPLPEFATPASEGSGDEGAFSIQAFTNSFRSLPASYAVSYNGAAEGLLPDSLRNQRPTSLCWAFSAALLAEISMIKNRLASRSVHYSEHQIGYFFYNHVVDPKGGTVSDATVIVPSSSDYVRRGGNNFFTNWHLAAWASVRNHEDMPFRSDVYTVSEATPDLAYNSVAHMQNSYWFSMESTGDDISYIENVKELVYKYGAASVIIYSGTQINKNHAAYNASPGNGHNVTIVGWDDDFSADLFSTRPSGDGAWYIRDNYGTEGNRDENGCYWMSYYDRSLRRTNNKAIACEFEAGDNYDNNYQYDGGCGGSNFGLTNTYTLTAANVFTAQNDETLEAVGFSPASAETDYTVSIYKLVSENKMPDDGEPVSQISGSTRYVGFRTVPLKEKVSLSAGQVYSVVVKLKAKDDIAKFFVDADYDASPGAGNWLSARPSSSENQSYVKNGTTWYDMHTYGVGNRVFRIKAYTNDANDMRASYELLDTDDYTYDGVTEHKVKVTVSGTDGTPKTEDVDYSVKYLNNLKSGTARVSVNSLTAQSLGNRYFTFDISPKTVSEGFVTTVSSDVYTGDERRPEVSLSDNKLGPLRRNIDYYVEYSDNVNAGTGHVTFTGIGSYTGSITRDFIIEPKQRNLLAEGIRDCVYSGSPITQPLLVKDGDTGEELSEGTDYSVSYQDNINAGTAKITVSVSGNYTGSVEKTFRILQRSVSGCEVSDIPTQMYTGKEVCPEPSVKDTGLNRELEKGTDYTLSYNGNTDEGWAEVNIIGKENYEGNIKRSFFISGAPKKELEIKKIKDRTFEPGKGEVRPQISVVCEGNTLVEGRDYVSSYVNNDRTGTASVNIAGISETVYDNSKASAEFKILPYSLKKATIEGIADRLYYEGKDYSKDKLFLNVYVRSALTGEPVVLSEGIDYTISFNEATKVPKKAGKKVYFYIEGKGNYTGRIKKSFTVRSYIPVSDTDYFKISLTKEKFTYDNGKKIKPGVKVEWRPGGNPYDTEDLTEGEDYRLSYSNNKNAGRGCVTIKPTSSFKKKNRVKGSARAYFTIAPLAAEGCRMVSVSELTYNSKARKPSVTVYTSDGKRLKSSQYYVEYKNNIRCGTAGIRVYGKKNYTGFLCEQKFEIKPQSFGKVKLQYKYDAAAGGFKYFRVKYGTSTLRENIDYIMKEDPVPDSKGRYTITVNAVEGRNFLNDRTKTVKYKK